MVARAVRDGGVRDEREWSRGTGSVRPSCFQLMGWSGRSGIREMGAARRWPTCTGAWHGLLGRGVHQVPVEWHLASAAEPAARPGVWGADA